MPDTGWCMKCKAKKEIKDAQVTTMKNGRNALKGKCPDCNTGMYKILGKKKE
jgi:Zn finger protein HypA/HybF involved in hydrogenase expression